jgi:hypothetical protein
LQVASFFWRQGVVARSFVATAAKCRSFDFGGAFAQDDKVWVKKAYQVRMIS